MRSFPFFRNYSGSYAYHVPVQDSHTYDSSFINQRPGQFVTVETYEPSIHAPH